MFKKIRMFFNGLADMHDYETIAELENYKRVADMLLSC